MYRSHSVKMIPPSKMRKQDKSDPEARITTNDFMAPAGNITKSYTEHPRGCSLQRHLLERVS